MADPRYCPRCDRTNPPDAQVCVCGYLLDPERRKREKEEREEREEYERVRREKREPSSAVRIVEIKITFSNALGLVVQFWLASLVWALPFAVAYGMILSAAR